MAAVVFSLTTKQVASLMQVKARGRVEYRDYGTARVLKRRGLLAQEDRQRYSRHYTLTAAGDASVMLIRALKLDLAVK